MFKVAISHSLTSHMPEAAASLTANALRQLDGAAPVAALLFSTWGLDHPVLLSHLAQRLPGCPLVGCSSYGEVSRDGGYRLGSSVLVLFACDFITIKAGVVRGLRFSDAAHNQATLAQQMAELQPTAPVLGLIFPDGVGLDGESVVTAFADMFPKTRFFGGAAAENMHMNATSQFCGAQSLSLSVSYLLFYGPLRYTWAITEGFKSGWRAVGQRLDARCEGQQLLTIDQRPAVEHLAARYKLEGGVLSVCHPFVIYPDRHSDAHYFRDVVRYCTDSGALESMQLLPAECQVQLTEPDPVAILDVSRQNIHEALARFPGTAQPALALWFSCVSRSLVLQAEAQCEFSTALAQVPNSLPIAGFYTYGEIAPLGHGAATAYHSSTLVTLLLGEEPRPSSGIFAPTSAFSSTNLQHENRRLSAELASLQDKVAALEQELQAQRTLARLGSSQPEAAALHRALALELLCSLLDTRFDELKRHGLKGHPSHLNRSGLARLISQLHLEQTGQPFPLSEAQLARLLLPSSFAD